MEGVDAAHMSPLINTGTLGGYPFHVPNSDGPWEVPPGLMGSKVAVDTTRDAAYTFLKSCGMDPTPDAVAQLTEVFLPCLRIMCERGYEPSGDTWREGGWRSQLVDVRKKFKRLWYHGWLKGKFVPDHGYDLINYTGFYQRLHMSGSPWGDWGEPEGDRNG